MLAYFVVPLLALSHVAIGDHLLSTVAKAPLPLTDPSDAAIGVLTDSVTEKKTDEHGKAPPRHRLVRRVAPHSAGSVVAPHSTESASLLSTAPRRQEPDPKTLTRFGTAVPTSAQAAMYYTAFFLIASVVIAAAYTCIMGFKADDDSQVADTKGAILAWLSTPESSLRDLFSRPKSSLRTLGKQGEGGSGDSSRSTAASGSSSDGGSERSTKPDGPLNARTSSKDTPFTSSTSGKDESQDKSMMGALLCATTWMLLSGALTLYNAWMFSDTGGKFPFVIFLTCWHQFLNTCLAVTIRVCCPSLMPSASASNQTPWLEVVRHVAAPAFLLTTTLSLGNMAYLYQSVSLIQMVKAAMPLMTYVIACMFGMEAITSSMTLIIVAMIFGTSLTIAGEITLSMLGLAMQLSSFCAEGLRLVCLKRVVSTHGINLDPLSGLLYYAPMCCSGLACLLFLTGEWHKVVLAHIPVGHLIANGSLACSLNVCSVFLLRECSATTLAVCGVFKDMILVMLSTRLFGNVLSPEQMVGFVIVLCCIYTYSQLKQDPFFLLAKFDAVKSRLGSFSKKVPS